MKREVLVHYGGYALSSLGAVVGVSLLSHVIPANIYGSVALYIAIATLFQTIVRESLSNAMMRHASEIRRDKTNIFLLIKNIQLPIISCYIAICLFSYFWVDTEHYVEMVLSFLLILWLGIAVAGEAFLSSVLKRGACAIHLNLIQWLRFPMAALFYVYYHQTVSSVLLGFVLIFFITSVFDWFIWKQIKPAANIENQSISEFNIFKGFSPILIGFFVWFTTFYDRIAIERIHNEDMLGIYFVLIQIAYMPVVVFMRSSANYLFPLIFDPDKKILNRKNIAIACLLLFSAWVTLMTTHRWLFSWLVGEQYRQYSWLLPWLFLAAVLNAVSYLVHATFFQSDSMKTLLSIKGVTAGLYFLLVTLFAYFYAIEGVVIANVCVSFFLVGITYTLKKSKKIALK